MVAYIIQLAKTLISETSAASDGKRLFGLLAGLSEELNRLDPRDFLPAARSDFVLVRLEARSRAANRILSSNDYRDIRKLAERVVGALEQFGGESSRVVSRSFSFIKDAELRKIIERDYRELRLMIFPSRAWKSTVVLAGSILEAILFDQLTADTSTKAKATTSMNAPKDRKGNSRDLVKGDWTLADLIEVSAEIGIFPSDRAKSLDQVLRDYRNFVHPKKEIRSSHPCTEAEAMMSVGALEGVCNILGDGSVE